jgi:multidrug efflux pump subunit AcrB
VLRSHPPDESHASFFERTRARYGGIAEVVVRRRWLVVPVYLLIAALVIVGLGSLLGREIFPIVDAGQFTLRVRAPSGTRIEKTEQVALQALEVVKREAGGADNVTVTMGFVGVQPGAYPVNVIHLWTSGSEEAVLQVQLKRGAVRVEKLKETLRAKLPQELPGVRFSFEPSDIVSRVMSFGSPTPVQVAVTGPDFAADRAYGEKLRESLRRVSALRDLEFEQELDYPAVKVDFDRPRAGVIGVTVDQAARALAEATSSSRYTAANFWADPKSGVGYQVQVQIPEARMNSLEEIRNVPVANKQGQQISLRQIANIDAGTVQGQYDRYNMQRMLTLNANISGEDLGRVARRVEKAVASAGELPPKVTVAIRGQIAPMRELFNGLSVGMGIAVIVIFLLLSANFQSFRLALAVVLTVPAVVAGVVIALLITRTTINIQSFMGAIMAIGVAVANAILLVTFAERSRVEGMRSAAAAIEGASSRLRPILMTSCAMVAGMIPIALGLGEGGEQTAPLGRAVVGGLVAATVATLFVLPALFAVVQPDLARKSASMHPDELQRRGPIESPVESPERNEPLNIGTNGEES